MANKMNFIHYVIFGVMTTVWFGGNRYLSQNMDKFSSVSGKYFSETEKIKDGLNLLVEVYCRDNEGEYCGSNEFNVEEIEATRDHSYSTGTGKSQDGRYFWWAAVKNKSWWNELLIYREGEKVECSETVQEIPPKMFGGKLRYCKETNGEMIDRLKS